VDLHTSFASCVSVFAGGSQLAKVGHALVVSKRMAVANAMQGRRDATGSLAFPVGAGRLPF
jgi:hypothetical protein